MVSNSSAFVSRDPPAAPFMGKASPVPGAGTGNFPNFPQQTANQ